MVEIRSKLLRPHRYEVTDSDDYVTELWLDLLRERGTLVDGDIEYDVRWRDKAALEMKINEEVVADAVGNATNWSVSFGDRVYELRQPVLLKPRTNLFRNGSSAGFVARIGRVPEVIDMALDEPAHPALETFVGIVAMVGWRRVSASIAWSSPPAGHGL